MITKYLEVYIVLKSCKLIMYNLNISNLMEAKYY